MKQESKQTNPITQRILLNAVALLAVFFAGLVAWPTAGYDERQIHPRLQALNIPYQSVKTDYFLDGGSVGITSVDRDGNKLELALPV